MNAEIQESLKQISPRVKFDRVERKLYGHDIGAMPALIAPVVGSTIPDAVIQPQGEAELAQILKWTYENLVPVTPRGKATSGYGSVLLVWLGCPIITLDGVIGEYYQDTVW